MTPQHCIFVALDAPVADPAWGICRYRCSRCGATRPEERYRLCDAPVATCGHEGEATGLSATVVCITCEGRRERSYAIHRCAVFGECLPDFNCTRDSKEALAEWMEKEGRTVELPTCRGCEAHTEVDAEGKKRAAP